MQISTVGRLVSLTQLKQARNPQIPRSNPAWTLSDLFRMLSPSSVKQILVRSGLQLQLISRTSQTWLPVDSKSTDEAGAAHRHDGLCNQMQPQHSPISHYHEQIQLVLAQGHRPASFSTTFHLTTRTHQKFREACIIQHDLPLDHTHSNIRIRNTERPASFSKAFHVTTHTHTYASEIHIGQRNSAQPSICLHTLTHVHHKYRKLVAYET